MWAKLAASLLPVRRNIRVLSGDRTRIPFWPYIASHPDHAFDWTRASVVGNGSTKRTWEFIEA